VGRQEPGLTAAIPATTRLTLGQWANRRCTIVHVLPARTGFDRTADTMARKYSIIEIVIIFLHTLDSPSSRREPYGVAARPRPTSIGFFHLYAFCTAIMDDCDRANRPGQTGAMALRSRRSAATFAKLQLAMMTLPHAGTPDPVRDPEPARALGPRRTL
jgi:hypothetical protein